MIKKGPNVAVSVKSNLENCNQDTLEVVNGVHTCKILLKPFGIFGGIVTIPPP